MTADMQFIDSLPGGRPLHARFSNIPFKELSDSLYSWKFHALVKKCLFFVGFSLRSIHATVILQINVVEVSRTAFSS